MLTKFLDFKTTSLHERCLSIFYTLGFLVLLTLRSQIYEKAQMTIAEPPSLKVFYFLALGLQLITAFVPRLLVFRTMTASAWLLLIYSTYSFGDFSHDHFGWLAAHFILIIPLSVLNSAQIFLCLRAFCLSIYCSSGMWKLRGLFLNHADHWFQDVSSTLPSHIARTYCEGVMANIDLMIFLQNHYYLSGLLWLALIGLQLSTVGILFMPKFDFFWGWLLIFFHLGTAFILGVDFQMQLQLITFIFLIVPAIAAQEDRSTAY